MTITIALDSHCLNSLDISPVRETVEPLLLDGQIATGTPEAAAKPAPPSAPPQA